MATKAKAHERDPFRISNPEERAFSSRQSSPRAASTSSNCRMVNFDLPMVPKDYIHRVGRTGRAGSEGQAVSLVSREEQPLLRDIQNLLDRKVEIVPVEGLCRMRHRKLDISFTGLNNELSHANSKSPSGNTFGQSLEAGVLSNADIPRRTVGLCDSILMEQTRSQPASTDHLDGLGRLQREGSW